MTAPHPAPRRSARVLAVLLAATATWTATSACSSCKERPPAPGEVATTLDGLVRRLHKDPARTVRLDGERDLVVWEFVHPWSELEPPRTYYLALTRRVVTRGTPRSSNCVERGGWFLEPGVLNIRVGPPPPDGLPAWIARADAETLLDENASPQACTAIVRKLGWIE